MSAISTTGTISFILMSFLCWACRAAGCRAALCLAMRRCAAAVLRRRTDVQGRCGLIGAAGQNLLGLLLREGGLLGDDALRHAFACHYLLGQIHELVAEHRAALDDVVDLAVA